MALIPKFIFLCILGPAINASTTPLYLSVQTYGYLWFSVSKWLRLGKVFREDAANAKASLNMKRLFVRYVSHEIRTPLNTVLMGLQYLKQKVLERDTPNDPTVEVINEVEGSCDAAVHILNDLLDYEKLESGILVLNKTKIFIWQLVSESVREFQLQARQAGVLLSLLHHHKRENELDN